jgi:hypothetical protein
MAPNGQQTSMKKSARPSENGQPQSWSVKHGHSEWQAWRDKDPSSHKLSYDAWKQSGQNVNGLSLYYITAGIWDEPDSDVSYRSHIDRPPPHVKKHQDEKAQPVKAAKSLPAKAPSKPVGRPKKKLTANGDGLSRATELATPSSVANLEDLSPSAKKKRKARKKPVVSILGVALLSRLIHLVRGIHRVRHR